YLVELIDACHLSGVVISVNRDQYNSSCSNQFKTTMGDAYSCCALLCAQSVTQWASDVSEGPVILVYEHGQPNSSFIKRMLDAMMEFDDSIAGTAIARK